jgi:hypothetical protein
MPLIFPRTGKLWGRLAICGGLVTRPEPPVHRPPAPAFGPPSIARRLTPLNPSAAPIAAAREVLRPTADYLNRGATFAVETTLSSRNRVDLIRQAKSRGY